jgi:hypothetical protein
MQAGLPVLCLINAGNDLVEIIQENNVGRVSVDRDINFLEEITYDLLDCLDIDLNVKNRCRNLYLKLFSPEMAVKQIVHALEDKEKAI